MLVTGASRGLGREVARQLAARGFLVRVGAREEGAGRAVAEAIRAEGGDARHLTLDVTRDDHVAAAARALEDEHGRLDVLVNNAGAAFEWDGTTAEGFRQTLAVNLVAPWALTEALTHLLARSDDARVIHHASVLGSIASCVAADDDTFALYTPAYASSKAGLDMLTVIQSRRLAPLGIAVAAAHPGWVKTDLGTDEAPMDVAEGAQTAVALATMARADFPHGRLVHAGRELPW